MINEKIAFLNILKDYLNRGNSILPDNINWLLLYEYAKKHNIVGVLYYQTRDKRLRLEYTKTIYQYHNRKKALEEIESELNKAGMQYFLVKGMIISQFYQKPELRTMGDCDVVVHDKEAAAQILRSVGFEIQNDGVNEFHFSKYHLDFELHDQLLYRASFNEEYLREFFNDCWSYVIDNKMDDNFHFLFAIAHLRKHFLCEGVGFRLFMDIAVFSQQKLDWEWILNKLYELKLTDFAKVCFAMIERWFGFVCPIESADISDEFYEQATEAIFENGVYGGENGVKVARLAENTSKVSRFINLIFLPYSRMRERKRYQFVDGKPWLMPVAWIYRWLTAWRKGIERVSEFHENNEFVTENKETIESRQQQVKDWKV